MFVNYKGNNLYNQLLITYEIQHTIFNNNKT